MVLVSKLSLENSHYTVNYLPVIGHATCNFATDYAGHSQEAHSQSILNKFSLHCEIVMKATNNLGRPLPTKDLWANKRSLAARGRPGLFVAFIKISQQRLLGQQKIFGSHRPPRIMYGLHYNLTTKTNIIRYSFENLHPGMCFTAETRSTCCICSQPLKIFGDLKTAPNYIEVVEGTLHNEFLEKIKSVSI